MFAQISRRWGSARDFHDDAASADADAAEKEASGEEGGGRIDDGVSTDATTKATSTSTMREGGDNDPSSGGGGTTATTGGGEEGATTKGEKVGDGNGDGGGGSSSNEGRDPGLQHDSVIDTYILSKAREGGGGGGWDYAVGRRPSSSSGKAAAATTTTAAVHMDDIFERNSSSGSDDYDSSNSSLTSGSDRIAGRRVGRHKSSSSARSLNSASLNESLGTVRTADIELLERDKDAHRQTALKLEMEIANLELILQQRSAREMKAEEEEKERGRVVTPDGGDKRAATATEGNHRQDEEERDTKGATVLEFDGVTEPIQADEESTNLTKVSVDADETCDDENQSLQHQDLMDLIPQSKVEELLGRYTEQLAAMNGAGREDSGTDDDEQPEHAPPVSRRDMAANANSAAARGNDKDGGSGNAFPVDGSFPSLSVSSVSSTQSTDDKDGRRTIPLLGAPSPGSSSSAVPPSPLALSGSGCSTSSSSGGGASTTLWPQSSLDRRSSSFSSSSSSAADTSSSVESGPHSPPEAEGGGERSRGADAAALALASASASANTVSSSSLPSGKELDRAPSWNVSRISSDATGTCGTTMGGDPTDGRTTEEKSAQLPPHADSSLKCPPQQPPADAEESASFWYMSSLTGMASEQSGGSTDVDVHAGKPKSEGTFSPPGIRRCDSMGSLELDFSPVAAPASGASKRHIGYDVVPTNTHNDGGVGGGSTSSAWSSPMAMARMKRADDDDDRGGGGGDRIIDITSSSAYSNGDDSPFEARAAMTMGKAAKSEVPPIHVGTGTDDTTKKGDGGVPPGGDDGERIDTATTGKQKPPPISGYMDSDDDTLSAAEELDYDAISASSSSPPQDGKLNRKKRVLTRCRSRRRCRPRPTRCWMLVAAIGVGLAVTFAVVYTTVLRPGMSVAPPSSASASTSSGAGDVSGDAPSVPPPAGPTEPTSTEDSSSVGAGESAPPSEDAAVTLTAANITALRNNNRMKNDAVEAQAMERHFKNNPFGS